KTQLGGDTLEARVAQHADLERAAALLAQLGHAQPRVDVDHQRVSIPTQGGTAFLLAAGHRFEDEHIPLDDLGIRRPSLDDVFLALTAHAASDTTAPQPTDETTTQ